MVDDKSVILGTDTAGVQRSLTDIDRRSGLYILGIQGSGKTNLLKNLIFQDIKNGHGVFFLDPHGDAIEDLLQHIPEERKEDVILLDPADDTHTFGINVFSCLNPASLRERSVSYAQAEHIFTKLFANPQTAELDILLSQYLPNTFYPLIANQGYTILEIPLLLREKAFRAQLLRHSSIPAETLDFWHEEFESLRQDTQREETASTRRRINLFRSHEYVKHIVGQSKTTVDFTDIMDSGKILFVKFSATLAPRVQDFIGTMLLSNLVYAILQRERVPEAERRHFCLFVDEFARFASSDDFAVLFTQGRKFAIATTVAHQERYGQFAENKRMLGATDTARNKVFFQQSPKDAHEHAPEVSKAPNETPDHGFVISQEPFFDLLRGHEHPKIRWFVNQYLRPLQEHHEDIQAAIEGERLIRLAWLDEAALSRVDERWEGIYAAMVRGRDIPVTYEALANTERLLTQVREVTSTLRTLHEQFTAARLTVRALNRALTAIMEQRLLPTAGNEEYSALLISSVDTFWRKPAGYFTSNPHDLYFHFNPLYLYISLVYGNPQTPRALPLVFAQTHHLFPDTVAAVYQQRALLEAWEKEEVAQAEWKWVERSHKANLRSIAKAKQARVGTIQRRIQEGPWPPFTILQTISYDPRPLLTLFLPFLAYPRVQEILTPYLTARFAPPWRDKVPNIAALLPQVLERVQFLRQDTMKSFNDIRGAIRAWEKQWVKIISWSRRMDEVAVISFWNGVEKSCGARIFKMAYLWHSRSLSSNIGRGRLSFCNCFP